MDPDKDQPGIRGTTSIPRVTTSNDGQSSGRTRSWRRQPQAIAAAAGAVVGCVVGVVVGIALMEVLQALYGPPPGSPLRTLAVIVVNACIMAPAVVGTYALLRPKGRWGRGDGWRVVVAVLAAGIMEDVIALPFWWHFLNGAAKPALLAAAEGAVIVVYALLGAFAVYGVYTVTKRREAWELEPRCRRCGLPLEGVAGPRCPRCGEPLWRARAARRVKVAVVAGLGLLLVAWAASAFVSVGYRWPQAEVGLGSQMLWALQGPAAARLNPKGAFVEFTGWDCVSVPGFRGGPAGMFWRLPLWIPAVLLAAPIAYMARRGRRIPPGHCWRCGYDLTGNTSGVCPECGIRTSGCSNFVASACSGSDPQEETEETERSSEEC